MQLLINYTILSYVSIYVAGTLRSDAEPCSVSIHLKQKHTKGCFYRSPPHRGHLLTLCVSSAAGSVSSSKGRSPDTDSLQRQKFLPFLLNVSHRHLTPFAPLLSCLSNARPLPPSGSLYYFILLQSLPASIISASALSLYLSLPLTSLQHCSAAEGDASTLLFLFLVFCLQGV